MGIVSKTLTLACCLFAALPAAAQYPTKPIRFIVPLAAGGPTDAAARAVGQALSKSIGQAIIVENKPGADGLVAAQAAIVSAPDGYTLLFGNNSSVVVAPLLQKEPPFNPRTAFTAVSFIARVTFLLYAHPSVPAQTIAELIAYARANPDKLSYGSGTAIEAIVASQFSKTAGISIVRVPYKGGSQAFPDLIANRVQLIFGPPALGLPHVKEGRLKALAALPAQFKDLPNVPSLKEAGMPQVTASAWIAVFGPANMPKDVTARLSRELTAVLQIDEVKTQFERLGFQPEGSTPDALASILREDLRTWPQLIRDSGLSH